MGSGSSRQTQAGVTDSMGSSVDCRCTAGELRTSKSLKEPSKRFESWLVRQPRFICWLNKVLFPQPGNHVTQCLEFSRRSCSQPRGVCSTLARAATSLVLLAIMLGCRCWSTATAAT